MFIFSISSKFGKLKDELLGKVINMVDSVILNLPNFVIAILVFILFLIIAKYAGRILDRILFKTAAQRSVRIISIKVAKVIIISLGFFIALGILNLDKVLTSVLGAAGVIGLAIGLALQGTLNNTFSGVILSFLPRIQIGDWLETNDFSGKVIDIDLRSVVLQTADQNIVAIPNSKIIDSPFKNFSRTDRGRITVECGVGYESDLNKVQELTEQIIKKNFEQKSGEGIEFYYTGFGDSSINFIVRFWANVRNQKDVFVASHKAILGIKKTFDENNINIPFPIRTLDFGKNKFRSETIQIANKE
ncbi:mechanosensitive ion channel family protein [Psychroflexus planctonicus]|uniref:Mechanosensitive ion channel protein MscS n=1 Tax=Psychroflexus planctonicus TaxID=1526575 RepID=A0ABQ1SFM7_9FLAO|nr:mechanosensitive ion channel [Psychroflexus planctonicus]GGE27062.1 mechanosensitive ion channel protein MscS [Psychroflexus planctonicus]